MRKLAALALIAVLTGCMPAPAPQFIADPNFVGALQVMTPPARYAAAGLAMEQAGRISYRTVPRETAERICRGSGACAFPLLFGACQITVSNAYTPAFRAEMINHERAHCAGWPDDHPA